MEMQNKTLFCRVKAVQYPLLGSMSHRRQAHCHQLEGGGGYHLLGASWQFEQQHPAF